MDDPVKIISESRTERGRGSREGREAIRSHASKSHSNPTKARVRIYKSIDDALHSGYMGQIFSTHGSDRLYVVTKHKWGKSGQQNVSGRTAKGFTPGSIPSSFKRIKKYSVDTMRRHSGGSKKKVSELDREKERNR